MSTLLFRAGARTVSPWHAVRKPDRPAQPYRLLLWVSGALAAATVALTVALVAGKSPSHEPVPLEIAHVEQDPFYQQKLDAKAEELPAQF